MNPTPTLRGLYAITSAALCRDRARLLAAVEQALAGGARLIQYRDKDNDASTREGIARDLLAVCRQHRVPLIINDDVWLAAAIGADGVHVGAEDASLQQARAVLGPGAILGATCGNQLARAKAAVATGADYVAFGRFFPSRTKPGAPPAALELLQKARTELTVPLCAIGGITPDNAPLVIGAGADLVAAVEGVFGAADIAAAARAYAQLFTE